MVDTHPGDGYGEAAFRHFLSIERERAARSNRSFFLLKLSVRSDTGRDAEFTPAAAARLWPLLRASVRDVDFVGWYRTGRIAAAVLTQGGGPVGDQVPTVFVQRLTRMLAERLPGGVARRLQVRVIRIQPRARR